MSATARSYGMFPQMGFLVDEQNLVRVEGTSTGDDRTKSLSIVKEARAGINFGVYFDPAALTDTDGFITILGVFGDVSQDDPEAASITTEEREIAVVKVSAGAKSVITMNGFEAYHLREVKVTVATDAANSLTAGQAQVSLF